MPPERIERPQLQAVVAGPDLAVVVHLLAGEAHAGFRIAAQREVGPHRCAEEVETANLNRSTCLAVVGALRRHLLETKAYEFAVLFSTARQISQNWARQNPPFLLLKRRRVCAEARFSIP